MPKPSSNATASKPEGVKIHAVSQQSRFHTETLDTTTAEIDLNGVTIAIGERELIAGAKLKFKEGVRYALVGRCVGSQSKCIARYTK